MVIRTYSILVTFAVLSLIGVAVLPRLAIQLAPSQGGRSITINYTLPNAAPEAVERQVTARLEGAFAILAGIKKIRSVSSYNKGYVTLEIDRAADLDALRFEVAALVRQVYPQLPHELTYPQIDLNSPDDENRIKPLLSLQLSGPVSPGALQRYAEEQLKPRLAAASDVSSVAVFGGTRPEWVLTYNADMLNTLELGESDLRRAVQQYFLREPLGQLRQGNGQILRVSLDNASSSTEGWSHIPVANRAGRLVYLNDLITASHQEPPAEAFYRINGKTAVNLVLTAVPGTNQLQAAERLRRNIASLKLPPGYHVDIEYDTTTYIRENLRKIAIQTAVAVVVLLLFVALTTRSKRYVLLIVSSTVVTLLLSVLLFATLRVEIHLYSLAALTTSLGIIMDNVIVMIDHYRRYRDLRVFTALLGATLTTCAGLVVVWFLPEENRQALNDFAVVMAITLFISLLVAVGFVPTVMQRFWNSQQQVTAVRRRSVRQARRAIRWERLYARMLTSLLQFRKSALLACLLVFGLPIFWLPSKLNETNPLAAYYNPVFGSDWYNDNLQPFLNKWLGGTLRLFVNYVYEGSYQREPERTALYIVAELPNQSTPEQMDAIFRRFETELNQYRGIDKFITQINNGQEGSLIVYFREPYDQSIFPYQLKNRAILLSTEMSGIDWNIFGVGQGFSQQLNEESPTFKVEMFGYNYQQLEHQAGVLGRVLEKHPRVQAVNISRSPGLFQRKSLYQFQLKTNPQALALRNISATALYDRLSDYNARPQPDLYAFIQGEYEAVKIIPTQSQMDDVWMLQQQALRIRKASLKLAETATIRRQKVTPEIYKEDQQYRRVISFEYLGSSHFGEKFLNKTLDEIRPKQPLGYTVKAIDRFWLGTNERNPYELIGFVVFLIYIICAVIFESLWQPLALIGLIPLSYVGVFMAFYLTESNFDQGGYASFILLAGNVVCAGIFIIAEMNRNRNQFPRLSTKQAYLKAFRHKIGPVLLTVLSTVVGMIPFLLYEQEPFWYTLGIGTIGGLLMSLVAICLYFPLFLLRKDNKREYDR